MTRFGEAAIKLGARGDGATLQQPPPSGTPSDRRRELHAMLVKAIASGDAAGEAALEAALCHLDQAEASVPSQTA